MTIEGQNGEVGQLLLTLIQKCGPITAREILDATEINGKCAYRWVAWLIGQGFVVDRPDGFIGAPP